MSDSEYFLDNLLKWHSGIDRNMPWKETKDPYKIWVSEIILQQTRVAQGTPYYSNFIDKFPTIEALANASEDDVMKMWQGLGYYSRARNMHASAKTIVKDHGGSFPENYLDILSLKGIGPYTAAAISSFAFNLPHAVVDGNVKRVIARYFLIKKNIEKPGTLQEIKTQVDNMVSKSDPAQFNQAIMDFGALICIPKNPQCLRCPINNNCGAYDKKLVEQVPLSIKKIKKKTRWLHYMVLQVNDSVHIEKRQKGDIWTGLYQFQLIETNSSTILQNDKIIEAIKTEIESVNVSKVYKHKLTHQDLNILFYDIKIIDNSENLSSFNLVYKGNLKNFAFPKIIDRYLEDKSIYL